MPKQFSYQYSDGSCTYDRITYSEQTLGQHKKFFLGKELEEYDYTQSLSDSFYSLLVERLKQLRKKYSYIRFFFSGGKDSRLVFDISVKEKIYFDEIVMFRHCPVGLDVPIAAQVETDGNAIRFLNGIKYNKSKITVINLDAGHYDALYSNKDWVHHGNLYTVNSTLSQGYFFKFVNPKFGYFNDGEPGSINLIGCLQPHVYWKDDRWKFSFIDYQFFNHLNETTENFMVSNEFPELLHGYVRDLSRELDRLNVKLSPHQTQLPEMYADNQQLRGVRDLVKEFRETTIPRYDLELPKMLTDTWRPSNHYFWKENSTYKTTLACMLLYNQYPWQDFFNRYVYDTDWERIKLIKEHGGVLSKEFSLS